MSDKDSAGSLALFKIGAAAFIALIAFVGGVIPLRKQSRQLLSLGNAFSGGIFLAAGLMHMLEEAIHGFEQQGVDAYYAYLCCIVGLLLPLFVERVLMSPVEHGHSHGVQAVMVHDEEDQMSRKRPAQQLNMYVLATLLGVHSLIEGLAVGVEDTANETSAILIAIVAHKFFAGFALGVSLVKANVGTKQILKVVSVFAATTPIGILVAMFFTHFAFGTANSMIAESMKAVAAGTFIYVALVEVIVEEFGDGHDAHDKKQPTRRERFKKFLILVLGIAVMLLVSHFHAHTHESQEFTQHDHSAHSHHAIET